VEAPPCSSPLDNQRHRSQQLSAASSWFIYSAHLKGWRRTVAIERQAAADGFLDLRVPITECKLMMLMRFRQLARLARIPFAAGATRRSAERVYNTTREALEGEGNFPQTWVGSCR